MASLKRSVLQTARMGLVRRWMRREREGENEKERDRRRA
jgi:hypothetical protein